MLKLSPHEVLRILKQRSFLETFVKDHGTTLGSSQILTTCGNSGKYQLLAFIDKPPLWKQKELGKRSLLVLSGGVEIITTRSLKNSKTAEFLRDVCQRPWNDIIGNSQILTTCGNSGKYQLLAFIDKHAPLKAKRTGKKKSPCIIYKLIRKLRKRAETSWKRKRSYWAYLKASRNKVNNSVKYAKGKYFNDNLTANKKDPSKTW